MYCSNGVSFISVLSCLLSLFTLCLVFFSRLHGTHLDPAQVYVCVCVLMYLFYLTLFDGLLASYIVVKLEKIYETLNCGSETALRQAAARFEVLSLLLVLHDVAFA